VPVPTIADPELVAEAMAERRAYVLGGPMQWRPWRAQRTSLISWALIALAIALPVRGLFKGVGSSMEEGFMLVFPERMLAGDIPNVDFLHLYGPGSLHTLMGWYQLFGASLDSQRVVGLLQHVAFVAAAYALGRAWNHRIAVAGALTSMLLVLTPIGLSALAWQGAVSLALWGIVFALRSLHTSGRERTLALTAAGALAGFALAYRPDLVIALSLAGATVLWLSRPAATDGTPWRSTLQPLAIGTLVGLIPMWIHLAVAGIGPSFTGMVTEPVRDLRPGRELPRPPGWGRIDGALQAVAEGPADAPWWRLPSPSASQQLFLWFFVVVIVLIGTPLLVVAMRRRRGATPRTTVLLVGSMLGLGLIGQALQRPDSTHLAWGSCVTFALLPALVAELIPRRMHGGSHLRRDLTAAGAVALVLLIICPFFTYRYYLLYSRISVGNLPGGYEVRRDDRRFTFGNAALQAASQSAIDDLDAWSTPGERLLVGPADLSRTIYSDAIFYHLFPELTPATRFIEMDPGLADRADSGLATDVASADWLLLTNFWTGWFEPNSSILFGSDEPNQVVAEQFCLRGNYDNALVLLYERCEQGDGVSPAGIGIGAQRRADLEGELAKRIAEGWTPPTP
jgi:hypothetical protein